MALLGSTGFSQYCWRSTTYPGNVPAVLRTFCLMAYTREPQQIGQSDAISSGASEVKDITREVGFSQDHPTISKGQCKRPKSLRERRFVMTSSARCTLYVAVAQTAIPSPSTCGDAGGAPGGRSEGQGSGRIFVNTELA